MAIFKSKRKKFNDMVRIKLSGKRICPTASVNTLVLKSINTSFGKITEMTPPLN